MQTIILFDGECNLCNFSVRFIIKRDPEYHFKFAYLQSDIGERLKRSYHLPNSIDSLLLIENNHIYTKSSAALRICKKLNGLWKLFTILLIIPKFIRDPLYNLVATSRYKWFGKRDQCMIPDEDTKRRFL